MKSRMQAEAIAIVGVTVGLIAATGCQTRYSQPQDLSLDGGRPMPNSLKGEPVEGVIYPAPVEEKARPWYIDHPNATTAPAPAATTVATTYTTYTVKKGDMLSKIAADHGLRTADLAAANPGINANRIRVGQKISIPSSGTPGHAVHKTTTSKAPATTAQGGTYIVKKGDILGRIANAHGVKLADLKKANNLTGDKIIVGQKLVIPGAATTQAKTVPQFKKDDKPVAAQPEVKPVEPKVVQPTPPAINPEPVQPVQPEIPTPDLAPVPPPVSQPTPAPQASNGTPYVVADGEDLYDIAVRWGVSTAELKRANNLEADKVTPGQSIIIPGGAR